MIRVEKLKKRLGEQQVLDGVDLQVARGETLALVGPSGTGKSVLLKHIVGLLTPDEGEVWIEDQPVGIADAQALGMIRKKFGYVFQGAALLESFTIRENLRLALDDSFMKRERGNLPEILSDALATVNLDESVLDKRPNELSGGMRKRVGVARAIIHAPEILLFDEPTTGLDPRNVAQVNELILRAKRRTGATSIVVTHDMASVEAVADRVALLMEGSIRFAGTASEFVSSQAKYVDKFFARDLQPNRQAR